MEDNSVSIFKFQAFETLFVTHVFNGLDDNISDHGDFSHLAVSNDMTRIQVHDFVPPLDVVKWVQVDRINCARCTGVGGVCLMTCLDTGVGQT